MNPVQPLAPQQARAMAKVERAVAVAATEVVKVETAFAGGVFAEAASAETVAALAEKCCHSSVAYDARPLYVKILRCHEPSLNPLKTQTNHKQKRI